MDLGLSGRHALVTGGAGGIGLATTRLLAAEGSTIGVLDRGSAASAAVTELSAQGHDAYALAADVSEPDQVARAVETAATHGPIDVLVVNAGIHRSGSVDETQVEEWDQVQSVNLRGAFLCIRAVLGDMKRRRSGAIVCVASLAGRSGGVHADASYASSKAGLIGLCRNVAAEAAPFGVRVNCVNPGVIDTALTRTFPPQLFADIAARHPSSRWGRPEEVAAAIVFLASPAASWIVGAQLDVNGGIWPTP